MAAAERAGGPALGLLAEALRRSQAGLMEQVGAGEQDDRSGRVRVPQGSQADRTFASVPLERLWQKKKKKKNLYTFIFQVQFICEGVSWWKRRGREETLQRVERLLPVGLAFGEQTKQRG